jgi:hypothetical protein
MFLLRFAHDLWTLIAVVIHATGAFVMANWIFFMIVAVILLWLSLIDPGHTDDTEGM